MASTSRKHPSFPKEMSAGKFQHLATEILHKIQNVPYRVEKLVDSWYIRKVGTPVSHDKTKWVVLWVQLVNQDKDHHSKIVEFE
jgi:hypothetical protein